MQTTASPGVKPSMLAILLMTPMIPHLCIPTEGGARSVTPARAKQGGARNTPARTRAATRRWTARMALWRSLMCAPEGGEPRWHQPCHSATRATLRHRSGALVSSATQSPVQEQQAQQLARAPSRGTGDRSSCAVQVHVADRARLAGPAPLNMTVSL